MTGATTSPKIPAKPPELSSAGSSAGSSASTSAGSSAGTVRGQGGPTCEADGGGGPAALSTIGQTDTRVGRDGGGSSMGGGSGPSSASSSDGGSTVPSGPESLT